MLKSEYLIYGNTVGHSGPAGPVGPIGPPLPLPISNNWSPPIGGPPLHERHHLGIIYTRYYDTESMIIKFYNAFA